MEEDNDVWWAEQDLQERRRWEEEQWRAIAKNAEGAEWEWLRRSIERRYGRTDSTTS